MRWTAFSKNELPPEVRQKIREETSRYGKVKLVMRAHQFFVECRSQPKVLADAAARSRAQEVAADPEFPARSRERCASSAAAGRTRASPALSASCRRRCSAPLTIIGGFAAIQRHLPPEAGRTRAGSEGGRLRSVRHCASVSTSPQRRSSNTSIRRWSSATSTPQTSHTTRPTAIIT